MRFSQRFSAACLTILLLVAATAFAASKEEPPQVSHDGLHLVPDSRVALTYVKPEADFSGYQRIMILDTYVAFRKGWVAKQRRTSVNKVSNRDIERMKTEMAELFREVFVDKLDVEGGYPVVEDADTDVLLLRPAIIDLEVTAPDVGAGGTYNFAASAGAATLYLELYDSVSGEILARAMDRQAANHAGSFMRWTNRVSNRAAARQVLGDWAALLRSRLDEIHGEEAD